MNSNKNTRMSSNNEDILKKILTSLMKQKSDIDMMIDQITYELNGSDDKLETRDRVDESKKSIIDKEDQDDDEKSDKDDAFTEDDLVNKSVVELKDIYKKLIGKAARGPSASKSEWLIGKILSKSTKEVESKLSDMKKVAIKNSKLVKDETDEDLDKIIFEGVEYNVTNLDNGEIWASNMDGKTVGYYKNDIIVFKSYDDQMVHHEQRC